MHHKTGKPPLSVSTDRIGVTAFRMAKLIPQLEGCDVLPFHQARSRTRIIEVYPGATMAALRIDQRKYKSGDPAQTLASRKRIVAELRRRGVRFCGDTEERCRTYHDALDACVCALTARFYLEGNVWPQEVSPVVNKEGWIYFPKPGSEEL